jgi:hypothetical protein
LASGIENEQGISEVCMVSYSTAHILSNALTPVTPDSEVSIGEGYIHARPGLHVEKLTILKYTVYHIPPPPCGHTYSDHKKSRLHEKELCLERPNIGHAKFAHDTVSVSCVCRDLLYTI